MYKFEELVRVLSTDSMNVSISYMDFVPPESTNLTGEYSELKLGLFTKYISLSTNRVSSRIQMEQMMDLKKLYAVDSESMFRNVLEEEMRRSAQKEMLTKMSELAHNSRINDLSKFKRFLFDYLGYLPKTKIDNLQSLGSTLNFFSSKIASATRRGPGNFVIVSVGMAAYLQDSAAFSFFDLSRSSTRVGDLYKVGSIGGLLVYADPYMKYNDNRVIIGRTPREGDPGLYYIQGGYEFSEVEFIGSPSLMPYKTINLDERRIFAEVGTNVSDYYMEVEFTRGYNFFKYVLEKIGIIKKKDEDLFR
jgi:hypothetical protein